MNEKQTQPQTQIPFFIPQPKISGVGVVIKKDGTISKPENKENK